MYALSQGTSMAAPVVAGIAAVMRALKPSLKAHQIKEILQSTAVTASNFKYGVVNAKAAYNLVLNAGTVAATTIPEVGSTSYTAYQEGSTSSSGGGGGVNIEDDSGGCGLMSRVNNSQGGAGPLGGNSLGLLSLLYFVGITFRSLRRAKKVFE
jgi:subtilisin family serine protease